MYTISPDSSRGPFDVYCDRKKLYNVGGSQPKSRQELATVNSIFLHDSQNGWNFGVMGASGANLQRFSSAAMIHLVSVIHRRTLERIVKRARQMNQNRAKWF